MDYPYLAYLDMQNALRNGCQARADSLAGRLLACEGDLELELYPELLIAALRTLHPERDIAREARLEAPSVVRLGDCVQGVPRPFRLPLTNAGQQSLSVEGIEMSCSCLELFDDMDFTLAPGKPRNWKWNSPQTRKNESNGKSSSATADSSPSDASES